MNTDLIASWRAYANCVQQRNAQGLPLEGCRPLFLAFLDRLQPLSEPRSALARSASQSQLSFVRSMLPAAGRDILQATASPFVSLPRSGPGAPAAAALLAIQNFEARLASGQSQLAPLLDRTDSCAQIWALELTGLRTNLANAPLNDTWTWNGTIWSLKSPAAFPGGRYQHAGFFDTVRNEVVIAGGAGSGTDSTDTWKWNGTGWTRGSAAVLPYDMSGKANGVWNYSTINVPAGVKLTFLPNAANTPVTWLASGDVTIDGELNLDGTGSSQNMGGPGGPGGFAGGNGGIRFDQSSSYPGTPGHGPGGGAPGLALNAAGADGTYTFHETLFSTSLPLRAFRVGGLGQPVVAGTVSFRAESTPTTDAHRFLRLSIQRSAVSP